MEEKTEVFQNKASRATDLSWEGVDQDYPACFWVSSQAFSNPMMWICLEPWDLSLALIDYTR